MANTKISQLPSATTPLAGTELVPIVQGGVTKNVAAQNVVTPGGLTTQVQYNNAGAFAGSSNLTFNGTTLTAAAFAGPLNGAVGSTTAAAGTFTTVNLAGATSGTVALIAPAVAGTQSYTLPTAAPAVSGYALTSTTAGVMSWAASSGSPGGLTTQIQFNNSGSFAGSANLTWDGTNAQIGATGALRFADADSSNYVAFKSPATVASNVTWTLPSTDGTSGQVLSTNGSGVLSWVDRAAAATTSVEYLVVAGGGGGGYSGGGGGGAGGYKANTLSVASGTSYTVTVGAAGAGSTVGTSAGGDGTSSIFSSVSTSGGGGGGSYAAVSGAYNGRNGGSGGGAAAYAAVVGTGGTGVSGEGFAGGVNATPSPYPSGGGGGAAAVGAAASGSQSGAGGSGTNWQSLGTFYAGGGGGGGTQEGATRGIAGSGSTGNGGNYLSAGSAASANTGGGGGGGGNFNLGANSYGGNGGSGVVILRYPNTYILAVSTTGSPTVTNVGGYRYYTFTGSGSITF